MTRLVLVFLLLPVLTFAEVSLEAPAAAVAGASIEVSWTGDSDRADFITIVPADAAPGTYDGYQYARRVPTTMLVPEEPGAYEIRYLGKDRPYPTLATVALSVTEATASLRVPASVDAGAELSIAFEGPVNERDFITIVEADTPEGEYGKYVYAKRANPATLRAPDEPGDYEVRYLTGTKFYTLASAQISIGGVSAAVSPPATADAGATFDVSWEGPNNAGDWIGIFAADAPNHDYAMYQRVSRGNPVTLRAPDLPGTYEVRYLTGQTNTTLATASIVVGGTSASVSAPANVAAGTEFPATWEGPANNGDWIGIFPADASNRDYAMYRRTNRGNDVTLRAPDQPGAYEVRYVTGQSGVTLATAAVVVETVSASLRAGDSAQGGTLFDVHWQGPDNRGDFIGLVLAGSEDRANYAAHTYSYHGDPVQLRAPLEPGDYELRYVTGQSGVVLARAAIQITPAPLGRGTLAVLPPDNGDTLLLGAGDAVELILDASGSMLQRQDGVRRIEIAKQVLSGLVTDTIPMGTPFALRVFGHKEADKCRTDLEMALQPLAAMDAAATIADIQAKNLARTPIGQSLELVASDLSTVTGKRLIVLVTDGEETCGGDAAEAIEALQAAGIDVRINIVGFAIDDTALAETFRYWATLGDGSYHEAISADDLAASMSAALQAPFTVTDTNGRVVARGTVGGDAVDLMEGDYQVTVERDNAQPFSVSIASDKDTRVSAR